MATSNDFTPITPVTLDSALENKIRLAVNAYAQDTPNNPLTNLGDGIAINKVSLRPMFRISVGTRYEHRYRQSFTTPFTGYSKNKVADVKDLWQLSLASAPSSLDNITYTFVVDGSERVYECPTCSGRGKVICSKCGGKGKYHCSTCGGTGTKTCGSCGGKGNKQCTGCSGGMIAKTVQEPYYPNGKLEYRQIRKMVAHDYCHGTGLLTCTKCGGRGKLTCSSCHGTGVEQCDRCSGSGWLVCGKCEGHGKMIDFVAVKQEFTYVNEVQYVGDTSLFHSGEFGSTYRSYTGYQVYSDVNDGGTISAKRMLAVSEKMGNVLKGILEKTDTGKTIFYQDADITRTDVYYIEYSYGGNQYIGTLVGDKFLPGDTSPISEHANCLMDKTEHYMRYRLFPQAWHHSKQAHEMNVYGTTTRASHLLAVAKQKMFHLHEMGAVLAFIILLMVGIPYIYNFYDVYNPVFSFVAHANDPNTMGYDLYPLSMTVISLLVMTLAYKHSKEPRFERLYYATTKANTIGIVWGFATYTVTCAVYLAIMSLIVAAGGSLLVTWCVGLALKALGIVLGIIFVAVYLLWELLSGLFHMIF